MANGIVDKNDLVDSIIVHLRESGFVVERAPARDAFVMQSYRGTRFPLTPTLTIPPAVFQEYLEEMSERLGDEQNPFDEALSLARIHLVEELTTDHGDGLNYVRALGYRRKRGKVEFFVDQAIPPPGGRSQPSSDMEWRAYPPASDEPG